MTSQSKKYLVISLVALFVIVAGIGYYNYQKGPVNVSGARAVSVTPSDLYTAYISDSVTAREKFDSKIIQVKGKIGKMSENAQKQQIIQLTTQQEGGYINCTMDEAAQAVKEGDSIIIKGICSGMGAGDPDLGIAGDVYITRSIQVN